MEKSISKVLVQFGFVKLNLIFTKKLNFIIEFIQGVSQFSVKGDKESKLKCNSYQLLIITNIYLIFAYFFIFSYIVAFRIYDMDNDGYISNGELFQVLKMMVGNNLKDTQLQQIVDKTIQFADKDEDGMISFEEFCSVRFILNLNCHSSNDFILTGGR